MEQKNIRNFCIIAHIDHGKSTLADRFLEVTKTIEKRKMKEQLLDQMDLERERGITIKMQPVRMNYRLSANSYQLNLIDTPGHIDFSYEVSRALRAVEGAILLVDATQGVQAQTITNVEMAKALGLTIIPVINKIDLPTAMVAETKEEIQKLLNGDIVFSIKGNEGNDSKNNIAVSQGEKCSVFESASEPACGLRREKIECFSPSSILTVSGKTGEGVEKLLEEVIRRVPPPKIEFADRPRALVFDFEYSAHQGIILYVRMFDGKIKRGDELILSEIKEKFIVSEIGRFFPGRQPSDELSAGEIGYVVTGIKRPSVAIVGDTVVSTREPLPVLSGYRQPKPVVWASIYPESQDDFDSLKQAFDRLRLSDSSLSYEEESSGFLGRGFRCGFLGMLHLEIIMERLKREFNQKLIVATPTVGYIVELKDDTGKEIYHVRNKISNVVYSPIFFPDAHLIKKIFEPWIDAQIIIPPDKIGIAMQLLHEHEAEIGETEQFGDWRSIINVKMPLRELMRNFFDELKSVTAGYGSLSYKFAEEREAKDGEIVRLDILVADELVPAFSKIVGKRRIQRDAEDAVEKLEKLIPRALFVIKIQAKGLGRILASRSLAALKKDVTGYLYGGDISRKKKLWEKQKKGKKRMKARGEVNIPPDVFVKMMQ